MLNLFAFSNMAVLPFWLMLILFPNRKPTRWLIETKAPVIAIAAIYSIVIAPQIPTILPLVARPELGPIQGLLATPEGTTLVWIHLLAFDLLAALSILEEDRKAKRTQWITSLNLVCTLMFGPLGYLLHVIKKRILK